MADDDDAYGQVPEQQVYDDFVPEPTLIELDEPWEPLPQQGPTGPRSWPSYLPPGSLALAAAATGLVALLGNNIGSSFGFVLKFSLGGNGAASDAAHTAVFIQLALAGIAAALGIAAVYGSRAVADSPGWTRDLAIAAVIVGVIAAGVHLTLLQTLDSSHIAPDTTFVTTN
ncbi:hypothetical protein acdb102_37560 [Acidothermaceae bacterium B102]|nr:hypothetical protein acdb102_37560 [Acidothermaceae bacterium B102]